MMNRDGMNRKRSAGAKRAMVLILALALMVSMIPSLALAQSANAEVHCYVEKANIQGDPGDPVETPESAANYELYETVEGTAPEYLKTKQLERRFAHLVSTEVAEDGSTNAYYARGRFTYVFDIAYEGGEMTIVGVTYKGDQPESQYSVIGKYEEDIIIPGMENGLMPVNTNAAMPNAYCVGWKLDERTEDESLMAYSQSVTERMLPTDAMPYEELEFKLTGMWDDGQNKCVLECWYEQMPEEESYEDAIRMNYNGKVYINYPATNYEMNLPEGSKPKASSAPGLDYITCIEPEEGAEVSTWQFLYDRQSYSLTFDTNGVGSIDNVKSVTYQQGLYAFDPGWTLDTVVDGKKFTGWYYDGEYVSDSLSALYMTPFDLKLEARWE